MEYYSAIKNEILPFAMMWMELESFMLHDISRSEKDNYPMILLLCGRNKTEDHREKEGRIKSYET